MNRAEAPPLIVDMDGALLRTDVTFEGVARALFAKPLEMLWSLPSLLRGRAYFKRRLAALVDLDVAGLPLREEFVAHLVQERANGRALHLVSGADDEIVRRVAARVGLFDSAQGSANGRNLKGAAKARVLDERFQSYAYAGDSTADLKVWRHARGAILAGASPALARKVRSLSIPIEAEFLEAPQQLRTWLRAFRLHQWAKNFLIFIPLLLSMHFVDLTQVARCAVGFLLLGLTASGTYIANDLADLHSDRRHRSKRSRPFASGALKVHQGLIVAPVLIAGGVATALWLAPTFGFLLTAYLATSLAYSLRLKAIPFLDVMVLAWLYTLRLLMGIALAQSAPSQWLLTFSMMFFFSLSLAKRHTEILAVAPEGGAIPGRGYIAKDEPITLAFGVASAVASLLIMTLYLIEDAFPSNVYRQPEALWLTVPAIGLWTMRIWLLAHRGEMNDDPVAFAVTDRISIALGGLLALCFVWAVLV